LNINEFIAERKGEWEKLERIVSKIKPGTRANLTKEELWDLGRLYSAAISDLSVMKSSDFGADRHDPVISYLNALVVQVHGTIYRKPSSGWSSVSLFLTMSFPQTFRRNWPYMVFSTGTFLFFGLLGFCLGLTEPGFVEAVVPEQVIAKVESGKVWFNDIYAVAPMASSHLMTHNISVTFLLIAAGISFGILTVYLLAFNGLLIGTIAALCAEHGLSIKFWSFVLPHASLEISAILIAGGAGLILGHALLDPGQFRRGEYVALRGRDTGILALGCVPMLVMAGFIEAFLSPSPLPVWSKFVFAGVSFASLMIYLLFAGRTTESSSDLPEMASGIELSS
jgi:uncharacterized membrane protein SpoIIM required for sporulation